MERKQVVDGVLWIVQDVYFADADGDAAATTYKVTSSSLAFPVTMTDDPIRASAEEQKAGATFTVARDCAQKMELSFESRIRDRAGNFSEPVPFIMSCTAPQPLDTRPLLVSGLGASLLIALVLLLAFWLLFRKRPAERLPALRSMLLVSLLFLWLQFLYLVLHEGGHSLQLLVRGVPITLYVHPFFFSGFSRPIIASGIWRNILGSATATPVALLVSLPFWKRRSSASLPLVMLFPYAALNDGINVMGVLGGDFRNLVQETGLPAAPFFILGAVLFCIGLISLFSLFPLTGLNPRDRKVLFALPASMFLISVLSLLVADIFVLGSPIDLLYFLGREIVLAANSSIFVYLVFGILLAVLYVTLFRGLVPRLPAWLQAETAHLTWKDLRIPGALCAVSLIMGLAVVI